MELWLDTTDVKSIEHAHDLNLLYGVTTNPSIIASSGLSLEESLTQLLDATVGPVCVQVVAETADHMIAQAKKLFKHSSRLIIKIPASATGYLAIQKLSGAGIPVLATAIFEPYQAYLSLKLGATYIAPYLGRMSDQGKELASTLKSMQTLRKNFGFEGKIMAAGIRNLDQFTLCAELGLDAITLPRKVYEELFTTHAATQKALDDFARDWGKMSLQNF